ncbi:ABC transporter permease [Effusibacillus lacus]|uniref:ABC transporter permease n=1 Tax=Effusibacillus lacus TaxID=1348429 RepID=A0A292YNG0_9BACL|nr:ABC-2 family transporter protein [Effusibacillus lacus]TCS76539.1 ABC-2 type transport system permease protein [Effusibacillus lacus]GAX90439.1 ABC transporter permease [Effusibacillus lacus]
MHAFRVYLTMIRASILSRLQYRADFLMGILGVFVLNGATLGTTWVLLQRFENLNGWTFWEIVFLYNLWLLGHSFRAIFFRQITFLDDYIVQGTFDGFLTRPASPLLQFLGREVHYMGVGDLILSSTMLTLAYQNLGLDWSPAVWGWFALIVPASTAVEVSLILMMSAIAFKTSRSRAIVNAATQFSFNLVQQYPLDMFNRGVKAIVTFILPFAFMNYYPSLLLLGKWDKAGDSPILAYSSPLVAVILSLLALWMWRWGIRQYQSTGS